ncbi:hypothetical protein ACEQ8H_004203 [Pleosporales sp. CAS-2024a]
MSMPKSLDTDGFPNAVFLADASILPVNTANSVDDMFLSARVEYETVHAGAFHLPDDDSSRTHDGIWYNTLCHATDSSDGTLFPLHEACIETSCRAIEASRNQATDDASHQEATLTTLYQLLNSRFLGRQNARRDKAEDSSKDIFDLCHRSTVYGPRSVLALTSLEWWGGHYDRFYANPSTVPDVERFVYNVLLTSSTRHEPADLCATALVLSTSEPHGLERLPNELVHGICAHLPCWSVIKLHRTSKTMAQKVRLDNAFWRDQLHAGNLLSHIWDLDMKRMDDLQRQSNMDSSSQADWNWRTAAKLLSTKQFPLVGCDPQLDTIPLGLWNRFRIWNTIETALQHDHNKEATTMRRSDSGIELRR